MSTIKDDINAFSCENFLTDLFFFFVLCFFQKKMKGQACLIGRVKVQKMNHRLSV